MEAEMVRWAHERPWILVAAIVIGLAGRLVKDDIKGVPNVPPRGRVWLALALGLLSGLAERKWGPKFEPMQVSWMGGVLGGLASSALAIVGHNALIESLRKGREIPIPWLTLVGVSPGPGKPPTIPPPPRTPTIPDVEVDELAEKTVSSETVATKVEKQAEKAEERDEKSKPETD